jgi:hypothetical protein
VEPAAAGGLSAATLVVVGALIAIGLAINPARVGWLGWRASGAEAALSLAIVAVLFLITLTTSLKVAGVEIAVPAAPKAGLDPIDPVALSRVSDDFVRSASGRVAISRVLNDGLRSLSAAGPPVVSPELVTAMGADATVGVGMSAAGLLSSAGSRGTSELDPQRGPATASPTRRLPECPDRG